MTKQEGSKLLAFPLAIALMIFGNVLGRVLDLIDPPKSPYR